MRSFLSSIGSAFEYYDFVIYMFFAPTINRLFFPTLDHYAGLMATVCVFMMGYLVRPLGGILFSHYGDTRGRKKPFINTILGISFATSLIAVLPTYQQVHLLAPALLLLLRILQGLAMGGEVSGALVYLTEMNGNQRRAFYCSAIFVTINIGCFLATGMSYILHTYLMPAQILQWGWKIPFLIGGLLGFVTYFFRKKFSDTPAFLELHAKRQTLKIPVLAVLREKPLQVLQCISLAALGANIAVLFIYIPTYLHLSFFYSMADTSRMGMINVLTLSLAVLFFSLLADKFGRIKILSVGCIALIIMAYWGFYLMSINIRCAWFGTLLLTVLAAPIIASYTAILLEMFDTPMRYTGFSLCFNTGFALFGGTTPLVSLYLIHNLHTNFAPCYYLITIAFVAFMVSISLLKPISSYIATKESSWLLQK